MADWDVFPGKTAICVALGIFLGWFGSSVARFMRRARIAKLSSANPLANISGGERHGKILSDEPGSGHPVFEEHNEVEGINFSSRFKDPFSSFLKLQLKDSYPHNVPNVLSFQQDKISRACQTLGNAVAGGLLVSTSKEVLFLFNSQEDMVQAREVWPRSVSIRKMKELLLAPMISYHFSRTKIRKTGSTIYLYYVRKVGDPVHRNREWTELVGRLGGWRI